MSFSRILARGTSLAATCTLLCTTTLAAAPKPAKTETPAMPPVPSYYGPQPAAESLDLAIYDKIRDEGFRRSHVMDFASALSDGIGPRLTGSPNLAKANAWTRDTLTAMGLENAHLEDWGEFGMGWEQINTWGRMVTPDSEPVWLMAAPWSPATAGAVKGDAVLIDLSTLTSLDQFKGKLAGKIVLLGAPRATPDITTGLFDRYTAEQLEAEQKYPERTGRPGAAAVNPAARAAQAALRTQALAMMKSEGVAAIITPSRDGAKGGGTGIIFDDNGANLARSAQKKENAVTIPNAVMMIEHYNRIARLLAKNVPVQLEVNIDTRFTGDHEHGFDTVAEIPGSDPKLKEQVVMVGGHLDSWISGTGATDNAAGVAVAMESVRILKALGLKPKRTIRVALWTGEEEGEYGSEGYVKQHFGEFAPAENAGGPGAGGGRGGARGPLKTTKEWETLDAYYNLDNGTGRVRGVYTENNIAIGSIFEQWIAPLKDLGVTTITLRTTGGTDHQAFDAVGLPGFQFIQDDMDYETRTHHSNMDTVDRLHEFDLEQAAVVEAIFLWNTSEREAMMPRKPFPTPTTPSAMPGTFPGATASAGRGNGGGRRGGSAAPAAAPAAAPHE